MKKVSSIASSGGFIPTWRLLGGMRLVEILQKTSPFGTEIKSVLPILLLSPSSFFSEECFVCGAEGSREWWCFTGSATWLVLKPNSRFDCPRRNLVRNFSFENWNMNNSDRAIKVEDASDREATRNFISIMISWFDNFPCLQRRNKFPVFLHFCPVRKAIISPSLCIQTRNKEPKTTREQKKFSLLRGTMKKINLFN